MMNCILKKKTKMMIMTMIFCLLLTNASSSRITEKKDEDPKPKPWPEQFHSVLVMNNTKKNELQVTDLWYDWPNGRNLNLIQNQLGKLLYDLEWNNGTSYYYTLDATSECRTLLFEVGILRPNWLEGATYLGQKHMDGFLCNVWEKVDFIWYYEDVVTRRPVYWLFYTGLYAHVITFEEGVVLEDSRWQAPVYCFNKKAAEEEEEEEQQETAGYPHQFLRDAIITEKKAEDPKPKPWPEQFHSVLVINNTKKNELQVTDLWYDWPNGRNLNLIQKQLGKLLYDVEWNNGTSYYYTLDATSECRTVLFEVGILRPNWLEGATYLGQKHMDGFLCNVWQKVDFLWYYEDVVTRRPVYWLFYTGRAVHVITFEEGAVLEDLQWQAPVYCFNKKEEEEEQQQQQQIDGYPHQFLRDIMPLAFT